VAEERHQREQQHDQAARDHERVLQRALEK
jgi:hypothetical protein